MNSIVPRNAMHGWNVVHKERQVLMKRFVNRSTIDGLRRTPTAVRTCYDEENEKNRNTGGIKDELKAIDLPS